MVTALVMAMLKRQAPYEVKGTSELLNGRQEGRVLAERLLAYLGEIEPDSIVPVDFHRVVFMDFSCADELMTRVLRRIKSGELGTRFILLQEMSPSVQENIGAVFEIRDLVCPRLTKEGKIDLIGKVGPELSQTYKLAVRKGKITARDVLAIAPEVGISAISNRLAKLQALGLLVRTREMGPESGGRQFAYAPVC